MSSGTHSQPPATETESAAGSDSQSPKELCLRNWLELPRDVTASILLRLGAIEIIESAQKVCTQWRDICRDPTLWRSIDMWNLGDLWAMPYNLEKMCRHAIDRSCGGLVDINIEYFGTDDLLAYIAQRTIHLKRLRLVICWDVSDEGLSEAASKFPFLEELEIYIGNTGKDAIEAVGKCCPLLKTFKYNLQGIRDSSFKDDEVALAIAQNMHGLRDLQLVGNQLTNHGLGAILDGCPKLQSLDLRRCFFVYLEGELGKRCAKQIKNLRCPNDSTHDYGFIAEIDEPRFDNCISRYDAYAHDAIYGYDSDSDYEYYGFDDEIYAYDSDLEYEAWTNWMMGD